MTLSTPRMSPRLSSAFGLGSILFCLSVLATGFVTFGSGAARADEITVPVNRAELIGTGDKEMNEVMVANPDIADVHVHGTNKLSIIGKQIGRTSLRIFDKKGNVLRDSEILVTYDLPAIRRALSEFLPNDPIGVKLVNTNIALIGDVRSGAVIDKAMQIVNEFMKDQGSALGGGGAAAAGATTSVLPEPKVINLLQVTSGQQVMLRVRVGEIQRTAVKNLGTILSGGKKSGSTTINGGSGGGSSIFSGQTVTQADGSTLTGFVPGGVVHNSDNLFGFLSGTVASGGTTLTASLDALETQGLFKVLAEPNLVALSGEQAEFLAGGEFPVPIVSGLGSAASSGVQYKKYGVSVQFLPYVISDTRIRLAVQPEVSEIAGAAKVIQGINIPTVSTRRAKTTVELAPGESFMIAGLMRDNLNSAVNQIPGLSEIPIFSALLRSTTYERNETELVIAVTPYLVDPVQGSDIRLPTDNFKAASTMEQFFYGALGAISETSLRVSETPLLEGPMGFMVD